MKINLYTTFYRPKNTLRFEELKTALHNNLELPSFDRVVVLLEDKTELPAGEAQENLELHQVNGVPSFNDFLGVVNSRTGDSDRNIIANTDIYFDESIERLRRVDLRGKFFALSRWNVLEDGSAVLERRLNSQDTWIFEGPVQNVDADFKIGQWACDNRLAFLFAEAGFKVTNPALDLKTYHLHRVGFRAVRSTSAEHEVPGSKLMHLPVSSTDPALIRWLKLLSGRYPLRLYFHSQAMFWGIRIYPALETVLGKKLVGKLRTGTKTIINKLRKPAAEEGQ